MADWAARVIGGLPWPHLAMVILISMLFVGWVIISELRTRHLVQLIRAWRSPAGADRAVQARPEEGQDDGR
ncbi:hypothetical protein GCM10007977_046600 [Dactylosporangium sucinum]|uniref:Uncharacterized protein n=2 Tax=Dactylosporangium sucinum TaxID=1424081 RepID=A0A917TVX3_9ACTN|nr:hypothetical protein GCM10007977_046600 [Dactylosporangium sucinum]